MTVDMYFALQAQIEAFEEEIRECQQLFWDAKPVCLRLQYVICGIEEVNQQTHFTQKEYSATR